MMINFSVMKDIARLLGDEWDLGRVKSRARGNVCAWIYLMKILEETDGIVAAKCEGRVVGACGIAKFGGAEYRIRHNVYHVVGNLLMNSFLVKDKAALREYYANYDFVDEVFQTMDGEISILIVDKEYRRQGLGGQLFWLACGRAKEFGIRKLGIETSDSCNLGFYEHNGCVKVCETSVKSSESAWRSDSVEKKAYVYMKEL